MYGKKMMVSDEVKKRIMEFNEREAITDKKLLAKCLVVLALTIGTFIFQKPLHLEAATIGLFGAAVLMLIAKEDVHHVMEKAEWTSIFFFLGLFVVVHSLVEVGLIGMLAKKTLDLTGGDMKVAGMTILWVSAIASAFIDNIPFVATMIPLLKDMAPGLGGPEAIMPLWWALSLGACLGGNGTLIGASANVVVAGMAAKNGHEISFIRFTRTAFPLMLISIVISTIYMWLRYFAV
jgi:Na+/H+ antiporter NhaD/arsenite permease-like protein